MTEFFKYSTSPILENNRVERQELYSKPGVAKSDMTCELNTTNLFKNKSWVKAKQIRVIFELKQLTCLKNRSCSCSTCELV